MGGRLTCGRRTICTFGGLQVPVLKRRCQNGGKTAGVFSSRDPSAGNGATAKPARQKDPDRNTARPVRSTFTPSMITFTPLSGSAHSQNTSPLAYLLQVDDVRILLDCGSPEWRPEPSLSTETYDKYCQSIKQCVRVFQRVPLFVLTCASNSKNRLNH